MFKPMLANNKQPDIKDLFFPQLVSRKMDGIRIIIYKGKILSRSLKEIPNKQLKEKFEPLRVYTKKKECILDGEVYSHKLTFQQIVSYTMTEDFTNKKSIKKFGKVMGIPEHLKFYCFDYLDEGMLLDICFDARLELINTGLSDYKDILVPVKHQICKSSKELYDYFKSTLNDGYEGLILKNPKGKYKFGRTTPKENLMYKLKPFKTFDAKITGVVQSTEVNKDAEKKTNELGRSVTSKKLGERHTIEKASAFWVEYEGKPLKVVLAMTDEEKVAVWANRTSLIGKWIEYKGMMVGAKDVPRHPVMIRYREDKDE